MNKLSKLIQEMSKEELMLIKRDLVSGNIDRQINMRLMSFEEEDLSEKFCPVCGGPIKTDSFKIEFGKDYLRKRAYFDGADCLEYFIKNRLKGKKEIH